MRNTAQVRIDYGLYKAIIQKKQELEKEMGVNLPFSIASKIFYIELKNKDNIKYENLVNNQMKK